ncbi:MAG: hypothetical protein ABIE68_00565 [bacterium]
MKKDLQTQIDEIKKRNQRVESDKAWELSWMRRISIAVLTYFIIVLIFWILDLSNPWINAIVATIAFILSTLSLSLFKKVWLKYIYKK